MNWKTIAIIALTSLTALALSGCNIPEPQGCIDQCGDGTCDEIVCQAFGCPCAEDANSCPQDCKAFYSKCENFQCVQAEGTGRNECTTDSDCCISTGPYSFNSISIALIPQAIFWAETAENSIMKASLNGENIQAVVSGTSAPSGIAINKSEGKIYWSSYGSGKIMKSSLDGSGIEEVLSTEKPMKLAIDPKNGKIYWNQHLALNGKIQRASLDGTQVETIVSGIPNPSGYVEGDLAIDPEKGILYYTLPQEGSIKSIPASANGRSETLMQDPNSRPYGLSLNSNRDRLYWADFTTNSIHYIELAAGQDFTIIPNSNPQIASSPINTALDGRRIYWLGLEGMQPSGNGLEGLSSSGTLMEIKRAMLDGSSIETVIGPNGGKTCS